MSRDLNRRGRILERYVRELLIEEYEMVTASRFFAMRSLRQPIFAEQVETGLSIYGKRRLADFALYNPQRWPDCLVIQCKWQTSSGSVDEKYPYEVENIAHAGSRLRGTVSLSRDLGAAVQSTARYARPSDPRGSTKMAKTGIGHPHIDARSLAMAKIIVERIDADPTLIKVAHRYLENEERRRGRLSQASQEWKEILTRPWAEVREILLEESDEGQRLRSSKPFAGIVTEDERLAIIRRFPPPWPHVPYDPGDVPEELMEQILNDEP